MAISDYISLLDTDIRPNNPYSSTIKLQWVNEVDASIWYEIYKYKTTASILRLIGAASYALPAGVTFDKVTNVYVDGNEIYRIDASYKDTTGYFRGADGKLNIYPVPTANDVTAGLIVAHIVPFTKYTSTASTPLAETPYDRMYYEYMDAKMSFLRQEYTDFNNKIEQFNNTFSEYNEWWKKAHENT